MKIIGSLKKHIAVKKRNALHIGYEITYFSFPHLLFIFKCVLRDESKVVCNLSESFIITVKSMYDCI